MISKVSWDTTCLNKDKAFSFQNEVSQWSKARLGTELKNVLDELCPPDQVWKIDKLELDLGSIDDTNIQVALSSRFSRTLTTQLKRILSPGTPQATKVEVSSISDSYLSVFEYFLFKGYAPWWYKQEHTSFKQVLAQLLKDHKLALINKIRSLGKSAEVRKRLVRQLNDRVLQEIIKNLEPYHHEKLMAFKDHLQEIQLRHQLAQDNSTGFAKEAWYWLFSYILMDRGGLFDHTGFMRYMLEQMLARYALDPKVVAKNALNYFDKHAFDPSVRSDIQRLLSGLSNGNMESTTTENDTENWQRLRKVFSQDSTKGKTLSVADTLDLLHRLSIKEKDRLHKWLLELNSIPTKWQSFVAILDHSTYARILLLLKPSHADLMVEATLLLGEMMKEQNLLSDKKILWEHGLNYALHHTNKTSLESILECLVKEVSNQKVLSMDDILIGFQRSTFRDRPKGKRALQILEKLASWSDRSRPDFDAQALASRIRALLKKISETNYKYDDIPDAYNQLNRWITVYPVEAMAVFREFFKSDGLPDAFLRALDEHALSSMVRKMVDGYDELTIAYEKAWSRMMSEKKVQHTTIHNFSLTSHAVRILYHHQNLSKKAFVRELIEQLSQGLSKHELNHLREGLKEILGDQLKIADAFAPDEWKDLDQQLSKRSKEDFLVRTHELISLPSSNQITAGTYLKAQYEHPGFQAARHSESADLELILNYFISDGIRLKRTMIRKSMLLLKTQIREFGTHTVEKALTDLFWTCVLSYKAYHGQVAALQQSFNHAVAFYYNKQTQLIRSETQDQATVVNDRSKDHLQLVVKKGIEQGLQTVAYDRKKYELNESLAQLLASDLPAAVNLLISLKITDKRLKTLSAATKFDEFALSLMAETKYRESMRSLRSLYFLVDQQVQSESREKFVVQLWRQAWEFLKFSTWDTTAYKALTKTVIRNIRQTNELEVSDLLPRIQKGGLSIDPVLKASLCEIDGAFEQLSIAGEIKPSIDNLIKCDERGLIETLLNDLFTHQEVPAWFSGTNPCDLGVVLNEVLGNYPLAFWKQLRAQLQTGLEVERLIRPINMEVLVEAIDRVQPQHSQRLDFLFKMYLALGGMACHGFSPSQCQQAILKKVVIAWCNENWSLVSAENIWNELVYEVCIKGGVDSDQFKETIAQNLQRFPAGLQLSFQQLLKDDMEPIEVEKNMAQLGAEDDSIFQSNSMIKDGIPIKNAGQVILNSYLKVLFERLGLLNENEFKDEEAQQKAVLYLQYVITGLTETEEFYLVLNKVLCGLHPSTPVMSSIEITENEKELIEGMIEAIIGHWPDIGGTSVEGFRGNWLVRDGMLTEEEERWELFVDKRPYDLLLDKAPFGISIIRYPWMNKPMHVSWPY